MPVVLVPGLASSARIYHEQVPPLWRFGPVTIADPTRDDRVDAIARRVLATAPARFALVGFSLGGYIALEIMRQAPERVAKLALLDTSARPDTPEQTKLRHQRIAMTREGRFSEMRAALFPLLVHATRRSDEDLLRVVLTMAEEGGPEVFVRQQQAIIHRLDSRPTLAAIRCPTLALVGDCDRVTPPDCARELAGAIAGARLVIVPDCGHLAPIERPQAVCAALVEWMEC